MLIFSIMALTVVMALEMQVCGLLEEASLGMHPWQQAAQAHSGGAGRPGKRQGQALAERRAQMVATFCAKTPVYENCRMLAADGQLLSFIDARKLQWYEVRCGLPCRAMHGCDRLVFSHS